jgi:Heterokaryon incompatibility protein (HET)
MRLLHTGTLLFEEFPRNSPLYAILSHTWANEEVLYQDILSGTASFKPAWNKITKCCERARNDGLDYVWIDTCCT